MKARVWAAGLVAVTVSAGVAGAQSTGDATPQSESAALRGAPAVGFDKPGRVFASGAQARSAAAIAGRSVPLPRGGNFNGVRWEEAGAGLTDADVEAGTLLADCRASHAREVEYAKGLGLAPSS
jgi:hypothetical protein